MHKNILNSGQTVKKKIAGKTFFLRPLGSPVKRVRSLIINGLASLETASRVGSSRKRSYSAGSEPPFCGPVGGNSSGRAMSSVRGGVRLSVRRRRLRPRAAPRSGSHRAPHSRTTMAKTMASSARPRPPMTSFRPPRLRPSLARRAEPLQKSGLHGRLFGEHMGAVAGPVVHDEPVAPLGEAVQGR